MRRRRRLGRRAAGRDSKETPPHSNFFILVTVVSARRVEGLRGLAAQGTRRAGRDAMGRERSWPFPLNEWDKDRISALLGARNTGPGPRVLRKCMVDPPPLPPPLISNPTTRFPDRCSKRPPRVHGDLSSPI